MNVDIVCFATLSNGTNCSYDKSRTVSLNDDKSTARALVRDTHIPEEVIATILINGRRASLDQRLHEGDRVAFVPAVGGM